MNDAASKPAPRAIIIAGPNGAGKTTFAREFLTAEGNCPTFINADLIAAGLSPFRPDAAAIEASRLMLDHVRQRVARREDFAVETTLAGRAYLRMIRDWQSLDYQVELMSSTPASGRLC
jgi:predicted ABC-type ATPase